MLNNINEKWKTIEDFDDRYEVSNEGRVRIKNSRVKANIGKILVSNPTSTSGYLYVKLYLNNRLYNRSIHRLVAKAFVDNPYNKKTVNHIDGNKLNNNACNLEWATQSENCLHAYSTGLSSINRTNIGTKVGTSSDYFYVNYDKNRDRFVATVKILGSRKSLQKNFSCAKYGRKEAEILAAKAVNTMLDSLNDTERPRNTFNV